MLLLRLWWTFALWRCRCRVCCSYSSVGRGRFWCWECSWLGLLSLSSAVCGYSRCYNLRRRKTRPVSIVERNNEPFQTDTFTVDNAPAVYWSVLECDMFIICACLPALRSVLVRLAPGVFSTLDERSYPTPNNIDSDNRGYQRQGSLRELSDLSNEGGVVKTVDVDVYRTERSASDEVLVEPRKIPGI